VIAIFVILSYDNETVKGHGMLLTAVLLGVLGWVVVYRFVVQAYLPVDGTDLDAFAALYRAPVTPATRRLYGAYLSRARRYRSTWSSLGWGTGLFLSYQFRSANAGFGPGLHPIYADLLVMGFGGYMLGAVAAELHHLHGPASGVRIASLSPRDPSDYVPASERLRLRLVASGSALAVVGYYVLHFAQYRARSFSVSVVVYGAAATIVWVVIESAERAVVRRARPALPQDLAAGDDAIRAAAAQTLAIGGAGFVLLLTAWVSFAAAQNLETTAWAPVYWAVAIASMIGAVRLAFRTRRLAWPRRKLDVDGVPA
jgi:hypothetical protein